MTTQKQAQEEMVNTFVASIPTMQTDIALLKQDLSAVKKNGEDVLAKINGLSVVSKVDFDQFKQDEQKWKDEFTDQMNKRFLATETYIQDKKPGINFSNALVSRWTTFLVLLLLAAAVVALIGHFVPIGG